MQLVLIILLIITSVVLLYSIYSQSKTDNIYDYLNTTLSEKTDKSTDSNQEQNEIENTQSDMTSDILEKAKVHALFGEPDSYSADSYVEEYTSDGGSKILIYYDSNMNVNNIDIFDGNEIVI
jgi:hypothetical protein